MVYHSVPSNKAYPDHMSNREIAKYDIQNVTYTTDGFHVDRVEATVTIYQTMEMKFNRELLISLMRQQGNGFYFKSKSLHLDWIVNIPYIHHEKSNQPCDILE